jgi:hypothetical protein
MNWLRTIRGWAKGLLVAALLLSLLASMSGVGVMFLALFIAPLFIASYLLYAVALKPHELNFEEKFGLVLAGLGAGLSLLVMASTAQYRWLPLCWLACGGVVWWLLRPPVRRSHWLLVALLILNFWVLPLRAFYHTELEDAVKAKDVLWARLLLANGARVNEKVQAVRY